jgi:hypothetical protein
MVLQITRLWDYATGQKNHLEVKGRATNTSFMELARIGVWNFLLLECIVRIDVYTVGDRWNFTRQWK